MKSYSVFNPKNDEHLVSPDHIAPKSYIKVTRIKENDHQLKKLWIVKQFFFCQYLGKCLKNSIENMHVDVRV